MGPSAGIRVAGAIAGAIGIVAAGLPDSPAAEPAAGTSCEWGTFRASSPPGACWRPYSAKSPFNRALPARAPQTANSGKVGSKTARFGTGAPMFYGGVAGGSLDHGHPLYFSESTNPVYTVHCTSPWGRCEVEGMRVRIPSQASPASGADGHMAVIDQDARTEYDFWQVRQKSPLGGQLEVSWGGRTAIGTRTATGRGGKATAAGYGLAAGVIRPEELAAGRIDHALFMTVKCTNGRSVWPAGRNTGKVCPRDRRRNAPAMGAHFFLRMGPVEIDALAIPAWQKTILRAMSRYGMYVGDTGASHHGWKVKLASGTSYESFGYQDPWVTLGRELGLPTWEYEGQTLYVFDLRRALNWRGQLRVARVCVGRGTC